MSINKIAIVGAGIFGCSVALELDKEGYEIVLFEKEADIMLMATKNNHNRRYLSQPTATISNLWYGYFSKSRPFIYDLSKQVR